MSKIDQVEDLQNLMNSIADSLSMQRFVRNAVLSPDESKCNCYQFLFSSLKKEISKSLGIIDAYFQCMSEFNEFDDCDAVIKSLQSVSDLVYNILIDLKEGGTENA